VSPRSRPGGRRSRAYIRRRATASGFHRSRTPAAFSALPSRMSKRRRTLDPECVTVHLPLKDATCAVCLGVIRDPAVGNCPCGQTFCGVCLEESLKSTSRCPTCNGDVTATAFAGRQWANLLDSLPRPCPNSAECKYKPSPRADIDEHAAGSCSHRLVSCPHAECRQKVPHNKLHEHTRLCRLKRCENFISTLDGEMLGCAAMGTPFFIKQHQIKCNNNNADLLRQIKFLKKRYEVATEERRGGAHTM
jgi:hypothetical protein